MSYKILEFSRTNDICLSKCPHGEISDEGNIIWVGSVSCRRDCNHYQGDETNQSVRCSKNV